jgi:hypothetical protein
MRALVLIMSGIGMILTAVPAQAQTYDPRYPVCLQSCVFWGAARSSATTHRWRNAMHQRQAARLDATPIHFLRLDIGNRLAEATAGNIADRHPC